MAFTVTASVPSFNNAAAIKIYVVTGASETGGNNAGVFANFGVPSATLTPAQSGSLIVLGLDGDATFTAEPNNTYDDTGTIATSENYADGRYTGTVTSGTGVTVGSSASVSGSACLAAYELVPNGTPAMDGSTPAAGTSTSNPVTSPSFTPPAGAVLAAVVPYDSTASSPTITISDTSGLGLTWTKRVQFDGGGFAHGAVIYTATIPGGGPTSGPALGQREPPSRPSVVPVVRGWRNAARSH